MVKREVSRFLSLGIKGNQVLGNTLFIQNFLFLSAFPNWLVYFLFNLCCGKKLLHLTKLEAEVMKINSLEFSWKSKVKTQYQIKKLSYRPKALFILVAVVRGQLEIGNCYTIYKQKFSQYVLDYSKSTCYKLWNRNSFNKVDYPLHYFLSVVQTIWSNPLRGKNGIMDVNTAFACSFCMQFFFLVFIQKA